MSSGTDEQERSSATTGKAGQVTEQLDKDIAAAQAIAQNLENPEEAQPRTLSGPLSRWVIALALALAGFQLWTGWQGAFPNLIQRALHLGFVLVLIFVLYPPLRRMRRRDRVHTFDWGLIALSVVTMGYIVVDYDRIIVDPSTSTTWDILLGIIATVLVIDATRRTVGAPLPIITVLFIAYAYFGPFLPDPWGHAGFSTVTIIQTLYLTTNGMLGILTGVSATTVALFLLFGAVLFYTGGGETYVDIALYLVGRSQGGLGKVSCVSSALFGTVSGAAVANVVVDGVFNIPLMKRSGYPSEMAGAIEATASTGGQIVPPVMGAAAFIMAELIEISYAQIAVSAVIPALLYYTGVFATVHFEGGRGRFQRAPEERIPQLHQIVQWERLGPLFVPMGVLMIMLIQGYDPTTTVFYALLTSLTLFSLRSSSGWLSAAPGGVIIAALLVPPPWSFTPSMAAGAMLLTALVTYALGRRSAAELRQRGSQLVQGLDTGARSIALIGPLSANANMVVAMVGLTGLGVTMSELIIDMSRGNFFATLFFAMLVTLVMGMGTPTTAAYVLTAAVVGPALINLGLTPLAAHMFIFYFATVSAITPPVCTAVYVAAALAGSRWLPTSYHAVRIGIAAFIVPYMFVYAPALLLLADAFSIIWRTAMSVLGVTALAVASVGFLTRQLNIGERLIFFAAACVLIVPDITTDVLGLGLFAGSYVWQKLIRPAPKAAPSEVV